MSRSKFFGGPYTNQRPILCIFKIHSKIWFLLLWLLKIPWNLWVKSTIFLWVLLGDIQACRGDGDDAEATLHILWCLGWLGESGSMAWGVSPQQNESGGLWECLFFGSYFKKMVLILHKHHHACCNVMSLPKCSSEWRCRQPKKALKITNHGGRETVWEIATP